MTNTIHHHRRTIRLQGYDYSQSGMYFVTICCKDKICRFGKIENGEMMLNDAGKMIEKWCVELSHKFPDIMLNTYIITPNYLNGIIVNNSGVPIGADLHVCPDKTEKHDIILGEHIGSSLWIGCPKLAKKTSPKKHYLCMIN